jgi:transposase
MTMPQDVIGVDIAKDWIDAFRLASGKAERIPTTRQALARFARAAKGALVVLEASGGYERPLTEALAQAGVAWARVNPRQAREFARATGRLAKTDRVDARVLAEMGRALNPRPTPPADPDRARLADLVARREDLAGMIRAEKNRAGQARDAWLSRETHKHIKQLQDHLAAVEARIAALVAASEPLAADSLRLRSAPGLGPTLGASLLAGLPELGRMGRRPIASLCGVAPHACDSGLHRGKRRIWGGRAEVRRTLYLAAFIASRHDPSMKAYRKRLQDAGKPVKVALMACARKLLTILNAMFRDGCDYRATAI